MKQLLILFFIGLSMSSFAQKSDTLNIQVGKHQFIKVGDKIYKLVTTLEEVKKADTIYSKPLLWGDTTYPLDTSIYILPSSHLTLPTGNNFYYKQQ